MVMELLGASLEELKKRCNQRFSLCTVLLLADQIVPQIVAISYSLLELNTSTARTSYIET